MPIFLKSGGSPGGSDNELQVNNGGAFGGVDSIGSAPVVFDTNGNTRGPYANDFQRSRTANTQVASGYYAVISGGLNNTNSGYYSVIGGGDTNTASTNGNITISGGVSNTATGWGATISGGKNNTASGQYSISAGGDQNTASAYYSSILGGRGNTASGQYSTIGGGRSNNISNSGYPTTGYHATISGGYANTASGYHSSILGGSNNTASAYYSVASGARSVASKRGQQTHASGRFATNGDAQISRLVARVNTTNATPNRLYLDGSSDRITVPTNTAWAFTVKIIATHQGMANVAEFTRKGVIVNDGGTTSIGTIDTVGTDRTIGTPGAVSVSITADNTNDALDIGVTGVAATNIRWVALIDIVEVSYA